MYIDVVCPPFGYEDYCRDCVPCAAGEGDCDGDSKCESGLVCLPDQQGPGTDICIDSCPGDSNLDKDVDGLYLADYIINSGGVGLDDFRKDKLPLKYPKQK
jgi:hypothetical protein